MHLTSANLLIFSVTLWTKLSVVRSFASTSSTSFGASYAKFTQRDQAIKTYHRRRTTLTETKTSKQQPIGDILILDHLNINHEKGQHEWLKSFYFDFLKCAVDPRKSENLQLGSKTLWANIGSNQFHLPEGKPNAQVLEGVITLSYSNIQELKIRYDEVNNSHVLDGSKFHVNENNDGSLDAIDPWGTHFRLVPGESYERDERGSQPGETSEGLAMRDLTIHANDDTNIPGIARFYQYVLDAPILSCSEDACVISTGPYQTLTFIKQGNTSHITHVDMRDEEEKNDPKQTYYKSNYGPHVSIYVSNLSKAYDKANSLGTCYVNPRFKRRAYTKDEAIKDCMFRVIDVVDPDNVDDGVILQLEHEVRSVVKSDGSMYKSCPFNDIPEACLRE